jgi:transcriptional regulator with PAS, ATPase and Fis domain
MSGAPATPSPASPRGFGEGDPGDDPDEELELIVSCQTGVTTLPVPPRAEIVIGRDGGSDVVIADESVSRRHALLARGSPPTIRDLGSTNGTQVLGKPIGMKAVPFRVGSVAQVGLVTVVLQRRRRHPHAAPSVTLRPASPAALEPIVVDPTMQGLYRVVASIAPTPLSVLLLGETGTGKEVVAEAIHARSPRRGAALLKLNCGALPEAILESELFGHERGAFTGADKAKPGLFEAADSGTLFLDEVGELPRSTQVKLLRVLESGEVLRVGSVSPRRVDVRLVSATNRDLNRLVASTEFRMDLLFRINGFTFMIPPLRERKAEIAPLARSFAERAAARVGVRIPELTLAAIHALERYPWPGNIRELRNVIDRSVALCPPSERALDVAHLLLPELEEVLPLTPRGIPSLGDEADGESTAVTAVAEQALTQPGLRDRMQGFERERIEEALARSDGHQGKAAKLLGISRRTLFNKLEQYQIKRARRSPRS